MLPPSHTASAATRYVGDSHWLAGMVISGAVNHVSLKLLKATAEEVVTNTVSGA